jgi:hypothetical protein
MSDPTHPAECENGHELRVQLDGDGRIISAATIVDEIDAWVFVDASFCPSCGGDVRLLERRADWWRGSYSETLAKCFRRNSVTNPFNRRRT